MSAQPSPLGSFSLLSLLLSLWLSVPHSQSRLTPPPRTWLSPLPVPQPPRAASCWGSRARGLAPWCGCWGQQAMGAHGQSQQYQRPELPGARALPPGGLMTHQACAGPHPPSGSKDLLAWAPWRGVRQGPRSHLLAMAVPVHPSPCGPVLCLGLLRSLPQCQPPSEPIAVTPGALSQRDICQLPCCGPCGWDPGLTLPIAVSLATPLLLPSFPQKSPEFSRVALGLLF